MAELSGCPLVLFHPELQSGLHQQVMSLLAGTESPITVAAQASSQEMLISLVAAGYAVGLSCAAQLKAHDTEDVVLRPLAVAPVRLSTHLLYTAHEPYTPLSCFVHRALSRATLSCGCGWTGLVYHRPNRHVQRNFLRQPRTAS